VLGDDLYVQTEEFGEWEDSRRRIDLLAIDQQANLVVIELKRTTDGGHMELQAIRYASMISAMTFERAVLLCTVFVAKFTKICELFVAGVGRVIHRLTRTLWECHFEGRGAPPPAVKDQPMILLIT
jgi:hypothetical protein